MTTAVFPAPANSAPRRGSKFTIVMAVMLTLIAAVFGTRSFLEITAEEPASTLEVSPVTGMMPGHSTKTASSEEAVPLVQETSSPLPEVTPVASVPAIEPSTSPATEPPTPASVPAAPTGEPASPEVNPVAHATPQDVLPAAPTIDGPTSRILPPGARATQEPGPGPVITARTAASSYNAPPSGASNSESDAVLLDEVRTLERRGDETMSERRTEDALDLYHTALSSAEEYAARKGANPAARDQVVALMRKLGTLQMQNSSTAEARATYIQARKMLLQIKSQGGWTRERAKALDEIESRLLSLPRD